MLDRLLTLFREKVENRYYGKYRAIVKNNQDPENRGRLQVQVPALMGEEVIGWAMPCLPYGGGNGRGLYMLPEKEDLVWVEFEAGNISYPIWSGTCWIKNEAPKGVDNSGPKPDVKIIKSKSGHIIQLDDSSSSESVTIIDKEGNKIVMNSGSIEINAGSSDVILKGNSISVQAVTALDLKGATINVEASGVVTIKGATVDISP